jgi:large conductance mechanosensitive channel
MEKKEEEKPSTKECPFCFTSIDIRATRCPNCTTELKAK